MGTSVITLFRETDGDTGPSGLWETVGERYLWDAGTDARLRFYELAPGRYKVKFSNGESGWLVEYFNDKRTLEDADVIEYDGVTPRTGIDCTYDPAPVCISGTVHSADSLSTTIVTLYQESGDAGSGMWEPVGEEWLWDVGAYADYVFTVGARPLQGWIPVLDLWLATPVLQPRIDPGGCQSP